jgi:hypothetical protein
MLHINPLTYVICKYLLSLSFCFPTNVLCRAKVFGFSPPLVLEFELRASCLLGDTLPLEAFHQPKFFYFNEIQFFSFMDHTFGIICKSQRISPIFFHEFYSFVGCQIVLIPFVEKIILSSLNCICIFLYIYFWICFACLFLVLWFWLGLI